MPSVAVIILNWNGEKLLREFLPSVVKNTNPVVGRVIVADNASADGSQEYVKQVFPDVELICFEENFGFAGGYNRAIEVVEEEIIVLLNSDVEVTEGWLEPLVRTLQENPGVAAVQPKIKAFRDKSKFEYAGACGGFIDHYGFPFCRGRILDVTETDMGQYDDCMEVFWCSGAALCIRREVYRQAGGLDVEFFAHMEEIDLCWRMRNAGWSLKVNPASVVYHLGGGALPMNHPHKLFLNYRNNLLMLYKNLSPARRRKVMAVRWLLDRAAMLLFFLKGEWANVRSVSGAYSQYRKMKKNYTPIPTERKDACIYKGSIVWDYYFKGKKSFSSLFK